MGVGFDNMTAGEALKRALELTKSGGYAVTPNPEIVWLCRKNRQLCEAVNAADMVIADGIGIIYAAGILRKPLKMKLHGIDLAPLIMDKLAGNGGRVFLLGAKPGVAEQAAHRLCADRPGLVICGTHDGYFTDDLPVINAIREAKPNLILVSLGAPKQELWMHKNRELLPPCLMMGLGGSLDVYAGIIKRAPESWRRLNLEWLYRLIQQPRRIGRMMRLPLFLLSVFFERLRGERGIDN